MNAKLLAALAALGLSGALVAACGVPSSTVRSKENSGVVVFKVVPEEATVYIDGSAVGPAEDFDSEDSGLVIDSGKHVIELKHEGCTDYYREIFAGHGVQTIEVRLPCTDPS